jgi:hypothetical protein
MFRAAMPETAINEHRHPGLWEDEIRPAKNGLMPPPSGDAMPPKEPHQGQFGVPVPARADAGHDLRPLGFAENVRHGLS